MRRRAAASAAALALTAAVVACGDDDGPGARDGEGAGPGRCDWAMWGQSYERTFSYPSGCATDIAPDTVDGLQQAWFFTTDDAVTATPAVIDDTVYVGDWSGRFYALDLETGELKWSYQAEAHPLVYAGQIVSSAAVGDTDDGRLVYFGAGQTLYALDDDEGTLVWKRDLGAPGADPGTDPTEIESSPLVVRGLVIVGIDVHNSPNGEPAGIVALDAATGARRWFAKTAPTTGEHPTGPGCGDVWGSPSIDLERDLVFVGTGNCTTAAGWGPNSEALLALDLDRGTIEWTYQPHEQNLDDLDFAGAPNVFPIEDRVVVGLGSKDGAYYVVDPDTGELVWKRQVAEPGIPRPGGNYSTGGFIGATAQTGGSRHGLVVGGTAVGGEPYLHAISSATGEIAWQQPAAGPTYAAAAEANGVVFIGGTDFTFRALDLSTGEVLWSHEMQGAVAGGAAIYHDDVIAVAGLREPGDSNPNRTAGVYRFTLDDVPSGGSASTTTSASSSSAPPSSGPAAPIDPAALAQPCVAAACPLGFDLTTDRVGGDVGSGTVHVEASPFRVTVSAEGLGEPSRWLRPGSTAASVGAHEYGVYMSQGTDNPVGGLVCVLDEDFDCTGTENPLPGAEYDRISILAVHEAGELPSITEGLDRMVATNSLSVPFAPS